MHCSKFWGLIALLLVTTFTAIAQENSPYSRFGVGDILQDEFSHSRGMGGISTGLLDPTILNFANPASYAFLTRATLDFGIYGNILNVQTNDQSATSGNGSVQNLAMGFPLVRNKMGLSFGLVPFSRMQYNIAETRVVDSAIGAESLLFEGKGALYQAYVGTAYRYKGFSAGINMAYLFGNLSNTNVVSFPDIDGSFGTRSIVNNAIGGFNWKAGLGYQANLPNDLKLNFGLTGKLKTTVNGNQDEKWESVNISGDNQLFVDTVISIDNGDGDLVLPSTYSFGVSLRQGFRTKSDPQWRLGLDYSMSNWSQYEGFQASEPLVDGWKLKLGGELTPGISDTKEDAKRPIDYRMGIYYGKSNLEFATEAGNQQLSEFGMTLGFGIPVSPKVRTQQGSKLHLGLEIGQRGTKDLVRDSYIKGTLGVSLTDSFWFLRSKVN